MKPNSLFQPGVYNSAGHTLLTSATDHRMNRDPIPERSKAALLLLGSKPDSSWTCEAVANRLYIDRKQTVELPARLDADGFVTAAVRRSRSTHTSRLPCMYNEWLIR